MRRSRSENEKLSSILNLCSRERPDKTFLFELKRNLAISFREFEGLVGAACRLFRSLGLKKGDTVSAFLDNNAEFCVLYFASLFYGTVFNPFPYFLIAPEIKRDLDALKPKIIFIQEERRAEFGILKDEPAVYFVRAGPERGFLAELGSHPGGLLEDDVDPGAPACLYHTSAPESEPRGVLYSRRNIMALIPSVARGLKLGDEDVHLIVLPLGHTAALNYSLLPAALRGGSVVLADNFWNIRKDFWNLVTGRGITYAEVVPTILFILLHLPGGPQAPPVLKYLGCGSAPLSLKLQAEFEAGFGLPVANLYGLTETGPTHFDDPFSPGWKRGRIGRPLDINRVAVFDAEGNELPDGRTGEIAVQGDNVFPGYAINGEMTGRHFVKGFFRTGDLGARDGDGVFEFQGLKKRLIIRGGINVHPGEIDGVLASHPGVLEAWTEGTPDDFFGELIRSYVVLREGWTVPESQLKAFCAERLSPIKIPDFIVQTRDMAGVRRA